MDLLILALPRRLLELKAMRHWNSLKGRDTCTTFLTRLPTATACLLPNLSRNSLRLVRLATFHENLLSCARTVRV